VREQAGAQPRAGGLHTLHLVDVQLLTSVRSEHGRVTRSTLACCWYERAIAIALTDDLAVLGVDVTVTPTGLADPKSGSLLRCRDTGRPLTFEECANRYDRVVLAAADEELAAAVVELQSHGVPVIAVLLAAHREGWVERAATAAVTISSGGPCRRRGPSGWLSDTQERRPRRAREASKRATNSGNPMPRTRASRRSSTKSSRRWPHSYLLTKDCERSSRTASSTCVSPASSRTARSSAVSLRCSRL
jgi:hypothetical protein